VSPQQVIDLFEAALEKPGWIDDKVADQFPVTGGKHGSEMPHSGVDSGAKRANPNQGKKRGISKSLGADHDGADREQGSVKRQKGAQHPNLEP
jgi:hypothetical protein